MYRPRKVIDSHIHLITAETQRQRTLRMAGLDPRLLKAYNDRWEQSLNARNEDRPEPDPPDVDTVAGRWEAELERAGVEKAVFFTSADSHEEIARFTSCNPSRFIGYSTFDPTDARNAQVLERQVGDRGIRGLKLYPMGLQFRVNDPACFPVYEVCERHGLPVVIHFGLSINATHDLTYGNVLDLSMPAVRFPSVNWVVPHFGAGFFREALLVAAQYRNVFLDTSSSNNWIAYAVPPLTLEDLFRHACAALGSKRIIFGSDSSFFPRGYRRNILERQLEICSELGLSESEVDDIFHRNITQLLSP